MPIATRPSWAARLRSPREKWLKALLRPYGEDWGFRSEHWFVKRGGRRIVIVTFMPASSHERLATRPFFIVEDRAGKQIAAIRVGKPPTRVGGLLDRYLFAYALAYGRWNRRLLERHWYKPERCDSWDLGDLMRRKPPCHLRFKR